jgi:NADPH:quinone reductase-like Zn-dependent oxidoreductase
MKALRFSKFGPPSVLSIQELPTPNPGVGEVLVQVRAAAINPSDVKNVAGMFPVTTLPRTPGRDFAGVIVSAGKEQGKEVWSTVPGFGMIRDGVQAEYVAVPFGVLCRKPKNLGMEQAAAIGVPYLTAWATIVRAAQLEAGETLLIVGAAGAVGRAATQIAKWRGARVLGADRRPERITDADAAINIKAEDLRERVLGLTGGKGADAVLDTVGGPMFESALRSLRPGGRQIAITSVVEPRVSFNLVDFYHNASRLIGVDTMRLTLSDVAEIANHLTEGFEAGVLKLPAIEAAPFSHAVEIYERVAGGQASAKQVLTILS